MRANHIYRYYGGLGVRYGSKQQVRTLTSFVGVVTTNVSLFLRGLNFRVKLFGPIRKSGFNLNPQLLFGSV